MIRITALTGPHAGKTRSVPEGIDPQQLLMDFFRHGWEWRIDYTQATEEEAFLWGRQDLVARCIRALHRGLPVRFLDREFRGLAQVQEMEDAIADSGRMITLGRDDEEGVEVIAVGWEQ
jgi:hypothetical protein